MKRITRVKAIRLRCIDCSDTLPDIKNCEFKDCPLYPYRMGKRPQTKTTPGKAIHDYCVWCCNNDIYEVKHCPSIECALFRYRTGKEGKLCL